MASRRTLFPASWDAQQQAADVAAVVDEAVTGVRVVKGFGQEEQEVGRLLHEHAFQRGSGLVINLGSVAGHYPYQGGNVYGATLDSS